MSQSEKPRYRNIAYHKYCMHCGGKMVKASERISYYEALTGKPIYHFYQQCVNFSIPFGMLHDRHEFEGTEMVVHYDY